MFIIGDFLNPKDETDKQFDNWLDAYEELTKQAEVKENYLVGMWQDEDDYAVYVSINGEIFKKEVA